MMWLGLVGLALLTICLVILDRVCAILDTQGEGRIKLAYLTCDTRGLISFNKNSALPIQGKIVASFLHWYIVRRNKWKLF